MQRPRDATVSEAPASLLWACASPYQGRQDEYPAQKPPLIYRTLHGGHPDVEGEGDLAPRHPFEQTFNAQHTDPNARANPRNGVLG
jgi:hypothetical protein